MVESSKVSIPLKRLAAAGALALAMTALPASASLGGDAASIQADQVHMQGTRTMRAAGSYTVHEIQGENGTKVREYISACVGLEWSVVSRHEANPRNLFRPI